MTDHRGIAVLSRTIRLLAERALRAHVPDAVVTAGRPTAGGGDDHARLNICLLQASAEPAARNEPRAPLAVQLRARYLLSYFGPDEMAQTILGAIEIALAAEPVLDPADIADAVRDDEQLSGSGLDLQDPPVRLVPVPIGLEELASLWAGLVAEPYTLSSLWEASPVILSA